MSCDLGFVQTGWLTSCPVGGSCSYRFPLVVRDGVEMVTHSTVLPDPGAVYWGPIPLPRVGCGLGSTIPEHGYAGDIGLYVLGAIAIALAFAVFRRF